MRVRRHFYPFIILSGSIIFALASSILGFFTFHFDSEKEKSFIHQSIQNNLHAQELSAKKFINEIISDSIFLSEIKKNNPQKIWSTINLVKKKTLQNNSLIQIFLVEENNQPIYWSNSEYIPTETEIKNQISIRDNILFSKRNQYYYSIFKPLEEQEKNFASLFALIPIKKEYPIENEYLKSQIPLDGNNESPFDISFNESEIKYKIFSESGKYIFSLQFNEFKISSVQINYMFVVAVFLFTFFIFLSIEFYWLRKTRNATLYLIAYSLILIIIRTLFLNLQFPAKYLSGELFSPSVYASSFLNPSLGDFILNALFFLPMSFVFYRKFESQKILRIVEKLSVVVQILISLIGIISIIAGASFYEDTVRTLVINSNITFNLNNIFELNTYNLLSLSAFGLWFTSFFLITFRLTHGIISVNNKKIILYLLLTIILLIALRKIEFLSWHLVVISFSSVSMILFFLLWNSEEKNKSTLIASSSFLIIFSFITTLSIIRHSEIKERELQRAFANKLTNEHDALLEYLYNETKKKIKSDAFIQRFFKSRYSFPEIIANKIQRQYLNPSFVNYWNSVYLIDGNGKLFYEQQNHSLPLPYSNAEEILHPSDFSPTENLDLLLIPYNKNHIENFYRAKIAIQDSARIYGYAVIDFFPKTITSEKLYPNLLIDRKVARIIPGNKYSFAVYIDSSYVYSDGDFDYPLTLSSLNLSKSSNKTGTKFNHYKHFVIHPKLNKHIIVSRLPKTWFEYASIFSIVFFLFLILSLMIGFFLWSGRTVILRKRTSPILYRTKIQLYSILISFASLLLIILLTIPFIKNKFYSTAEKNLKQQARTVLNTLQKENVRIDSLETGNEKERERIQNILTGISDISLLDLNIFYSKGSLAVSTQPKIFELGLLSSYINPEAFRRINFQNEGDFIAHESIGKLNYLSAYIPIRDERSVVKGFLNIPYFAKQDELNAEISAFITYLVNIYLAILLLAVFFTFILSNAITRPLRIIQEKMETIRLGEKNEPIIWNKKDEIGKVVESYNSMLEKLEESERKLSKSERESAWREMARQVAHEIKNPLTPMKLSIQHLLRLRKEKKNEFEKKFPKTSEMLVHQIDLLNEIASSFSLFAKMTTKEKETFCLQNLLKENLTLYDGIPDIEIKSELPERKLYIYADRNEFSMAIHNIIKNAIQSLEEKENGTIELNVTPLSDRCAEIKIRDNGSGIPASIRAKIFTPNFSTKTSGMGLGLAIVKQAIDNLNGEISFESQEGAGTIFYIRIPLANESV